MSTPNITVHYLENSRAQRILWLLEELELPYSLKEYKRAPNGRSPPELHEIHPLGKSPVITDGELVVAESGAIVEYVIQKYGKDKVVVPESGWFDNLYFSNYVEGSLQESISRRIIFDRIAPTFPEEQRPLVQSVADTLNSVLVAPDLEKHGKLVEAHLEKTKGSWVAGGQNPTSADYLLSFSLETLVVFAPEYAGTRVKEYVINVQTRPAYKRAVERLNHHYAFIISN
ncbi:glutathione S-transferase [Cyathus striatus]|nr:glutathione S-transferase [Cyathus striatus]